MIFEKSRQTTKPSRQKVIYINVYILRLGHLNDIMGSYLGLFLLLSVSNGTLLQPEVKARVQSFIEASMECHHIPGMTLSIVEGKPI